MNNDEIIDIYEQIEQSTDVDFLNQLKYHVDMDIESLKNESDVIKIMKAKIQNITVLEMENLRAQYLDNLKKAIQNKLLQL